MASTNAITDYEADLGSRDRMKQRDAIRRVVSDMVRSDWQWEWPRPRTGKDSVVVELEEAQSDGLRWTERDEWESNVEDDESMGEPAEVEGKNPKQIPPRNGYAGKLAKEPAETRRVRKRKRLLDEMEINDGLNCYVKRRDAWTGARLVSNTIRQNSVSSPLSVPSISRSTSSDTALNGPDDIVDTTTDTAHLAHLHIQVPIAPPLLPPDTPLRKGITERTYPIIYDKVVTQGATPACPINLADVVRSCVQGWKADGEWPPRSGELDPGNGISHRRAVELGVDKMTLRGGGGGGSANGNGNGVEGKGRGAIKRGLQKVLTVVGGRGERKSL